MKPARIFLSAFLTAVLFASKSGADCADDNFNSCMSVSDNSGVYTFDGTEGAVGLTGVNSTGKSNGATAITADIGCPMGSNCPMWNFGGGADYPPMLMPQTYNFNSCTFAIPFTASDHGGNAGLWKIDFRTQEYPSFLWNLPRGTLDYSAYSPPYPTDDPSANPSTPALTGSFTITIDHHPFPGAVLFTWTVYDKAGQTANGGQMGSVNAACP